MLPLTLLALVVVVSAQNDGDGAATISCLDENGAAVDWWVAFKAPNGFAYTVMTSNDNGQWNPNTFYLGGNSHTPSGPAYNTLQQIYSGAADSWACFNDEEPNNGNVALSGMGHTKGVIASTTNQNGFFITHSIPQFPPAKLDGYSIGDNAYTYGQDLMCITVTESTLNTIAGGWAYTYPQIYNSNVANPSNLPNVQNAVNGVGLVTSASQGSAAIAFSSVGGVSYHYLVKNSEWDQDIYENLVAPFYQTNLFVDTWVHGSSVLASWCPGSSENYQYAVQSISQISLNGNSWEEIHDHSKWCVAQSNSNAVCLGDINRVYSQFQRGGGMVCTQSNADLFTALSAMVASTDACGVKPDNYYSSDTVNNNNNGAAATGDQVATSNNDNDNNSMLRLGVGIGAGVCALVVISIAAVVAIVRYKNRKNQQRSLDTMSAVLLEEGGAPGAEL